MKVITHGTKPDETVLRFTCWRCGCVFDADKGEYKPQGSRNEITFSCNCPECGAATTDYYRKDGDRVINQGRTMLDVYSHGNCPHCGEKVDEYSDYKTCRHCGGRVIWR